MPKSVSTIKVRLPYLYLCLEIVTNLKMKVGVNAFDRGFCWWNSNWKRDLENWSSRSNCGVDACDSSTV